RCQSVEFRGDQRFNTVSNRASLRSQNLRTKIHDVEGQLRIGQVHRRVDVVLQRDRDAALFQILSLELIIRPLHVPQSFDGARQQRRPLDVDSIATGTGELCSSVTANQRSQNQLTFKQ